MSHVDQFIPHLCVNDGLGALEFYKSVFGEEEGNRIMSPDGRKLVHGELVIDGHKCFLSDEFPKERGRHGQDPAELRWYMRANHPRCGQRRRASSAGGRCGGKGFDAGAGHVLGRPIRKDY